jgi:hypothetical protein
MKPASQPIAQGSAPPVPEDEDADDEDDAALVVDPAVVDDALVSPVVVNDPPLPPAPPAPPGPLFDPVLPPPVPVLSLVFTVPDEAHPVLSTPKIKDRVDPRTS